MAEKALLGLGMLVLAVVLPPGPGAPLVAIIMTAATLIGARAPLRLWLTCALTPMGFLAVGFISLALQVDVQGVGFAPGGLHIAAALAARSVAGVTCLLFLAFTTPTTDVISALRRVGIPAEITEIALLIYRFLFILADSALAMDVAQAARLGQSTARLRLRSLGLLVANLLPRAFDRARRLEIGLAARGWHGDIRVLSDRPSPTARGLAVVALIECITALVGVFA